MLLQAQYWATIRDLSRLSLLPEPKVVLLIGNSYQQRSHASLAFFVSQVVLLRTDDLSRFSRFRPSCTETCRLSILIFPLSSNWQRSVFTARILGASRGGGGVGTRVSTNPPIGRNLRGNGCSHDRRPVTDAVRSRARQTSCATTAHRCRWILLTSTLEQNCEA